MATGTVGHRPQAEIRPIDAGVLIVRALGASGCVKPVLVYRWVAIRDEGVPQLADTDVQSAIE